MEDKLTFIDHVLCLLACIAWRYMQFFSTQSGKAMKTAAKLQTTCLDYPIFLLQPPIIYFDNVMIGFVIRA